MRDSQSPRRRAAQLGWVTLGLFALALILVALAIAWLLAARDPSRPSIAVLPVDVETSWPGLVVVLAALAALAATFLGITALNVAAAMQVLARDRRIPPAPPANLQRVGRWLLGPVAYRAFAAEQAPDWPGAAVPDPEQLVPGATLRCTALIPAHNEEAVLGATLDSLARQSRPPDRIIVVADNCTDGTVELARARGVEVFETVANREKKAGALNQALERVLPHTEVHDVVLVLDADSTLCDEFLEVAQARLEEDPDVMAVGGLFYGEPGGGLVGQLQRNEFTRYQRLVARRPDRVFVLTGTGSVFRAYALQAVAMARGSLVPGPRGQVYDTLALTEDNELTLALKTLGARLVSPPECRVTTEIMTTWHSLWRQRLRWHRGALENIGAYGFTRATAMYWGQQFGLAYGVVALNSYFLLLLITLLAADTIRWSPFWVAVGLVFVVERLVTSWASGWRGRALAAPLVIELGYVFVLQMCFVTSAVQIATGREAGWNYVPRPVLNGVSLLALPFWSFGILLPTAVLHTDWYAALSLWVGINTLVFAALGLWHLLPPRRRSVTGAAQRSGTR